MCEDNPDQKKEDACCFSNKCLAEDAWDNSAASPSERYYKLKSETLQQAEGTHQCGTCGRNPPGHKGCRQMSWRSRLVV